MACIFWDRIRKSMDLKLSFRHIYWKVNKIVNILAKQCVKGIKVEINYTINLIKSILGQYRLKNKV